MYIIESERGRENSCVPVRDAQIIIYRGLRAYTSLGPGLAKPQHAPARAPACIWSPEIHARVF